MGPAGSQPPPPAWPRRARPPGTLSFRHSSVSPRRRSLLEACNCDGFASLALVSPFGKWTQGIESGWAGSLIATSIFRSLQLVAQNSCGLRLGRILRDDFPSRLRVHPLARWPEPLRRVAFTQFILEKEMIGGTFLVLCLDCSAYLGSNGLLITLIEILDGSWALSAHEPHAAH